MPLSVALERIVHFMWHQCVPNKFYAWCDSFRYGLNQIPVLSVYITGLPDIASFGLNACGNRINTELLPVKRCNIIKPRQNYSTPQRTWKTILFFWIIACCLLSCHVLPAVDGKPLNRERIRQDQRAAAGLGPRVYMPPLDLGFRGQMSTDEKSSKSSQVGNGVYNYQSDESVGSRWDSEPYGFGEQSYPQKQGYGQDSMEKTALGVNRQSPQAPYTYVNPYPQNQWAPVNDYDQNAYPLQYLHARAPTAQRLVQYVPPVGPGGFAPGLVANGPYQPPYGIPFDNNGPLPPLQTAQNSNPYTGYGPTWYNMYGQQSPAQPGQSPYYPQNNMAIYTRPNFGPSQQPPTPIQQSTTVLGHASNYEVISDEEIERRLKEYNDYLQKNRGENGRKSGQKKDPSKQSERHDNGLRLKGSETHDQIVRDFKKIASKFTLDGVDTLFDEIDLNKDGVIKLEEFRTFLWFHEIGVQG